MANDMKDKVSGLEDDVRYMRRQLDRLRDDVREMPRAILDETREMFRRFQGSITESVSEAISSGEARILHGMMGFKEEVMSSERRILSAIKELKKD